MPVIYMDRASAESLTEKDIREIKCEAMSRK